MTSAEARFSNSLRPRKPEGSLGWTAQDGHLDSHKAPELCDLLCHSKDFCSVCSEFDSGEISGRAQSLAPNSHPSMRRPSSVMLDLVLDSKCSASAPPPPTSLTPQPHSPSPHTPLKLTRLNYPLFARSYQELITKFRS